MSERRQEVDTEMLLDHLHLAADPICWQAADEIERLMDMAAEIALLRRIVRLVVVSETDIVTNDEGTYIDTAEGWHLLDEGVRIVLMRALDNGSKREADQ